MIGSGCAVSMQEEMIHFVRQWGTTLAYVADLPLPLPLQYDQTPNGCRLGLVRIHLGAVQLVSVLKQARVHSIGGGVGKVWSGHHGLCVPSRAARR